MSAALSKLQLRSYFLSKVRAHFASTDCIEVDCPAIDPHATIDAHIDPIETSCGYLHTSPEYGMKKLLAECPTDIYQLSHVFRAKESGKKHRSEFTMLEWYRINQTLDELIEECIEVISLFKPDLNYEKLSWKKAFKRYLNIDPFKVKSKELLSLLKPFNLSNDLAISPLEDLLDLTFSTLIEPKLPAACIIEEFPAYSAALARAAKDSEESPICMRFEIYIEGYEVANGYDELVGPGARAEMEKRFNHALDIREKSGKKRYPIDQALLEALEKIPPCVGVAVGFDRLLMLHQGVDDIQKVTF